MYRRSDHVATNWPYYHQDDPGTWFDTFPEAIAALPAPRRVLDDKGLLPILSLRFPVGDRTLVRGIRRVPWMAKCWSAGRWDYHEVPMHATVARRPPALAGELLRILRMETRAYVEDFGSVGILLSGGLDSRIVAGLLRELELERTPRISVTAYTWGDPHSRDSLIASRIANAFGWEWVAMPLSAELLWRNVDEMAIQGAFCAPFHLHAIPDIRDLPTLPPVILAGSYGDSMGRAEFSGRRVLQLSSLSHGPLNRFGLLKHSYVHHASPVMDQDLRDFRERLPSRTELAYRELERHAHYMRRMLHSCMLLLETRARIEQLFTHPDVAALVWSTSPEYRTDAVYEDILRVLPGELNRIPWARTGRALEDGDGPSTISGSPQYHDYGNWLRRELRQRIETLLLGDSLQLAGILNRSTMQQLLRIWAGAHTNSTNWLDENFAFLASFARFLELYGISTTALHAANIRDTLRRPWDLVTAATYLRARERFRN